VTPRPSALQKEIHQNRPFRSTAEEATLGVLRTSALIRRALSQAVEPAGITQPQYNVLRILRGAGTVGLPTLEVRDRLLEEAPGITRLMDKLELAGHVRRARSTPDRRQVICFITPRGLALLKKLDPVINITGEIGASGLAAPERLVLIRLLDKARASIRATNGGGTK
jgi:DNA-binding MarR family transcriptional regulator